MRCMRKPNSYTESSGSGRTFRRLYSKYPFGICPQVQKVNRIFPGGGGKTPDIFKTTQQSSCVVADKICVYSFNMLLNQSQKFLFKSF